MLLYAHVIKLRDRLIKCFLENAIAVVEEGFGRAISYSWPASCVVFGPLKSYALLKDTQEAVGSFFFSQYGLG